MKTPICDFVRNYANSDSVHLHMPGHKGEPILGFEHLDITEIAGADSLYEASGIIAESEREASGLFGCKTIYSTEGSSQCIKAMIYLAMLCAKSRGERPLILAGRNAHKAFHSAIALLDVDTEWIYPEKMDNYLSCNISANDVRKFLLACEQKPTALYITSPDYLGNIADVRAIADICHENGVLLIVDNAHGAYLRFLPESKHPMDLGADLCCDSAHKTLPVLTGGAYLHISNSIEAEIASSAKDAMSIFGSTSPSYLILQSLDAANEYLDIYSVLLASFVEKIESIKDALQKNGYTLFGSEALKITVKAKLYGYLGTDFAEILNQNGIVCEFFDPDFVVFMLTPQICDGNLQRMTDVLLSIPRKEAIEEDFPVFHKAERVMSIREAVLSPSETVSVGEAVGRVCALTSCSCPPAVPIVVSGERIDREALECFEYYGIKECKVIK